MNKVYRNLNRIAFLQKNYLLKFLFVAFIGIHIPLISIIVFVINNNQIDKVSVVIVSLLFTLIATAITLIVLKNLLAPLTFSRNALEEYLRNQTVPVLPDNYNDEAGILMGLIKESVYTMDSMMQEKQQITALLSHNLRVPFNQIKGLCEILSPENANDIAESINLVCDYQLKNINELLHNINNQLNKEVSLISDVSLKNLLQEEADMFINEMEKKQINLKTLFPEKDIIINTDKNKLTLVLQNLLNNALKFSYPGNSIYLSFAQKNNKVIISVKDEGIGFPKDYAKKIFFADSKLGRVGTAGEPSNGIGLNLSKKIMLQLGGDLTARSDGDNKGAEFTITI